MRVYFVALCVGILVGVIYGLLGVRSPAPPVVALVGLLGILLGEQAVPVARHIFAGKQPIVARMNGGPVGARGTRDKAP